jgi:DMSO/TMAO reductase YedYZ molybdopterin-dependent catalytic subunit
VTQLRDTVRQRVPAPEERVPPGQVVTTKWPVLHYGNVPLVDTNGWTFEVAGLVEHPFALTYAELLALPRATVRCDMHCVTRWSRLM